MTLSWTGGVGGLVNAIGASSGSQRRWSLSFDAMRWSVSRCVRVIVEGNINAMPLFSGLRTNDSMAVNNSRVSGSFISISFINNTFQWGGCTRWRCFYDRYKRYDLWSYCWVEGLKTSLLSLHYPPVTHTSLQGREERILMPKLSIPSSRSSLFLVRRR